MRIVSAAILAAAGGMMIGLATGAFVSRFWLAPKGFEVIAILGLLCFIVSYIITLRED